MFKSLSIKNYRTFDRITLHEFNRVNLIAGRNNVGKTALLEALYLLLGEVNASLVLNVNAFRGLNVLKGNLQEIGDWLWPPLFHDFRTKELIDIEGAWEDGSKRRLQISLVPLASAVVPIGAQAGTGTDVSANGLVSRALQLEYSPDSDERRVGRMYIEEKGIRFEPPAVSPSIPGFFLPARASPTLEEDARNFGQLEVTKEPYDLLDALRIIEPTLTSLRTIPSPGGTIIYGDVGLSRMLAFALLGDGFSRLASILVKIANARNGVVLVDEIENGFHHSVLVGVWKVIAKAARQFNAEIFATTHSYECITAAHEAFESSEQYDLRLHRLARVKGNIEVGTYDRETLPAAMKFFMEVR
jgi:AAA domain, putative AbiEii toxin, Type IV TA system/AAA ATPase domain